MMAETNQPLLNRSENEEENSGRDLTGSPQQLNGSTGEIALSRLNVIMPENGAGKENGAENETEDVNEDENGNGGTVAEDNNTVTGCVSNLNSAQEAMGNAKKSNFYYLERGTETDGASQSGTNVAKIWSCPKKVVFDLHEASGRKAKASRYVRFDHELPLNVLYEHYRSSWPTDIYPEIAITFLGGGEELLVTEKIEEAFTQCISKLLGILNCSFITHGSHVGISKLIGKVCSNESSHWKYGYTSRSFGIMRWCRVHGSNMLTSDEVDGVVHYSITPKTDCCPEHALDPNHDEYFLVDDILHEERMTDLEIISKLHSKFCFDYIPCVVILNGGGPAVLKSIHRYLFQNEGSIPVVLIIKGSGKLADLFCAIFATEKEFEQNMNSAINAASNACIRDAKDEESRQICENFLERMSANDKELLKECIKTKRNQIFIYDVDGKEDLQSVLYRATKKNAENSQIAVLKFAVNSGDTMLVKKLLEDSQTGYNFMSESLLGPISSNRARILLKQYDFDVKGYVCGENGRLLELYTEKNRHTEQNASEIGSTNLMIYLEHKYGSVSEGEFDIDEALEHLSDANTARKMHTFDKMRITIDCRMLNPMQALLINSLLFLDLDATKLFWYHDRYNPLSNALLILIVLKMVVRTRSRTNVFKEVPLDFSDTITYFESILTSLLDVYHNTSKSMTGKILTRKVPFWRNRTLLDVAVDVRLKSFIASPACETVFSKQWALTVFPSEGDDRDSGGCCIFTNPVLKPFRKLIQIITVPSVKLRLHSLMCLLSFLAFAFAAVLYETDAREPTKWTVAVIMVSLTLDEVRQVTDFGKGVTRNLKQWISSFWNILDLISILLFFVGFSISFHYKYESRIFFSLYLLVSCLKMLQFFGTWKPIGVYTVMIRKMLVRMMTFLLVILISVVGYGLLMVALLYPDSTLSWEVLFRIFFRPCLLLFGETGVHSFEFSNSITVFDTPRVHRSSEILVILAMTAFLFFANTLLINLLIAEFSNIHAEVLKESEEVWKFEKFVLLQEFKRKPALPIPFSVFENIFLLIKCAFKRTKEPGVLPAPGVDKIESGKRRAPADGTVIHNGGDAKMAAHGKPHNNNKKKEDEAENERREVADFERFCFKKLLPEFPADELGVCDI